MLWLTDDASDAERWLLAGQLCEFNLWALCMLSMLRLVGTQLALCLNVKVSTFFAHAATQLTRIETYAAEETHRQAGDAIVQLALAVFIKTHLHIPHQEQVWRYVCCFLGIDGLLDVWVFGQQGLLGLWQYG